MIVSSVIDVNILKQGEIASIPLYILSSFYSSLKQLIYPLYIIIPSFNYNYSPNVNFTISE